MNIEQIAIYFEVAFTIVSAAVTIASAMTIVVPADTKGGAFLKAFKATLDLLALNLGHAANGLPDSVQVKKPE